MLAPSFQGGHLEPAAVVVDRQAVSSRYLEPHEGMWMAGEGKARARAARE